LAAVSLADLLMHFVPLALMWSWLMHQPPPTPPHPHGDGPLSTSHLSPLCWLAEIPLNCDIEWVLLLLTSFLLTSSSHGFSGPYSGAMPTPCCHIAAGHHLHFTAMMPSSSTEVPNWSVPRSQIAPLLSSQWTPPHGPLSLWPQWIGKLAAGVWFLYF
jgi:hypothetical protein